MASRFAVAAAVSDVFALPVAAKLAGAARSAVLRSTGGDYFALSTTTSTAATSVSKAAAAEPTISATFTIPAATRPP